MNRRLQPLFRIVFSYCGRAIQRWVATLTTQYFFSIYVFFPVSFRVLFKKKFQNKIFRILQTHPFVVSFFFFFRNFQMLFSHQVLGLGSHFAFTVEDDYQQHSRSSENQMMSQHRMIIKWRAVVFIKMYCSGGATEVLQYIKNCSHASLVSSTNRLYRNGTARERVQSRSGSRLPRPPFFCLLLLLICPH